MASATRSARSCSGVYDEREADVGGKCGHGLRRSDRSRMIYKKLKPLETTKNPFGKRIDVLRKVTWVEPKLALRSASFRSGRRMDGFARPCFSGLRDDKTAEEAFVTSSAGEPLFPEDRKEVTLKIDGKNLKFTNLDKMWFPKDGFTKRDVLNYYDAVADLIVPHLAGRPLSLKRYPNGIHEDFFFQKDIPEGYPGWLRIEPIHSEHRGEPIRLRGRRRPRDAAVSDESRLHRSESVDEPRARRSIIRTIS